jgi:hypothetical protein
VLKIHDPFLQYGKARAVCAELSTEDIGFIAGPCASSFDAPRPVFAGLQVALRLSFGASDLTLCPQRHKILDVSGQAMDCHNAQSGDH